MAQKFNISEILFMISIAFVISGTITQTMSLFVYTLNNSFICGLLSEITIISLIIAWFLMVYSRDKK